MVRDRPGRTNRTAAERIYFGFCICAAGYIKYGLVPVNCPISIEKQSGLMTTETSRSSIDSPARHAKLVF